MLRVEAYERFKRRLMSGELRPGQFVTQRELAALAGVPLNPAREAIQRLAFESLVKIHPQRGVQVVEASPRTINEAYDFRRMMETQAVRVFAERAPDALVDRLAGEARAEIEAFRAGRADLARATETDWRMHDEIVDFMGNGIVTEAFRINAARIRLCRVSNVLPPERLPKALAEHLDILAACRARDADAAVAALADHIETSRDIALGRARA